MPWFIIRVTKGDALAAEETLKKADFEAYCPRETFFRAHRRDPTKTKREQHKALFPGYLFVAVSADPVERHRLVTMDLDRLLGSKLKAHLMAFNSKHLLARDVDIFQCKGVEAKIKEDAMRVRTVASYAPGDIVTILRGVLAGALGTVLSVRKRNLFVSLAGKANHSAIFVDVGMVK